MKMPDKPARRLLLVLVLLLCPAIVFAQGEIPDDADPAKAPDPKFIIGEPAGQPLTGDALEAKTAEVASLLRCPVCQGLSINDSPATMARNMKTQTRDLIAQGYSGEQVLTYFEKAYGEFVRLNPPKRGVNWLVWLAPVAFLIVGFVFVRVMLRKMSREPRDISIDGSANVPGRNELPEDEDLARYVLLARELAYGWTDGVAPETEGESE